MQPFLATSGIDKIEHLIYSDDCEGAWCDSGCRRDFVVKTEDESMIYSAGDCPICSGGDAIFLKNVESGKIFCACDGCSCAWNLPFVEPRLEDLRDVDEFTAAGYSLATADDIEAATLSHLIVTELPDGDLRFDSHPGFRPPLRRPQDYDGKSIAVILAKPLSDGKKEWAFLTGTGTVENNTLYLERGAGQKRFEIRNEWLQRIKPMWPNDHVPYRNCELYLSLALNAFPNNTPPDELMKTAQKWPDY